MGIAALVIGIISLLIAWIPCIGMIALFPAGVGLILGIIDIIICASKNKPKGMGIAGTICCAVAIACVFVANAFVVAVADSAAKEVEAEIQRHEAEFDGDMKSFEKELERELEKEIEKEIINSIF